MSTRPITSKQNWNITLINKKSELWHYFNLISLTENIRLYPEQREFTKCLLKLGNGELSGNSIDEIELHVDMLSNGHLIDDIFGNYLKEGSYEEMRDRTILAPLNKDISKINDEIIERLLENVKFTRAMIQSKINLKVHFSLQRNFSIPLT